MIVEIEGRRRKCVGWRAYKRIGADEFTLTYLRRTYPHAGEWAIPVEHGGKLACSFNVHRMVTGRGEPIRYRAVSWRQLPEAFRLQAVTAIQHVTAHGDPIDNDESIFCGVTDD